MLIEEIGERMSTNEWRICSQLHRHERRPLTVRDVCLRCPRELGEAVLLPIPQTPQLPSNSRPHLNFDAFVS